MTEPQRWQLDGNAPDVYEAALVPALFGVWAPLSIARAGLRAGERVLDVACGTGVVARLAADEVGARGTVAAIDLNPGMIARARMAPATAGAEVQWHEGDAASLPFESASFDAVFCQAGLQYFTDRVQAAREMHRVLAPHGRLVVLVWRALDHCPGFAALADALERHVGAAAAQVMRAPFAFGDGTEALREPLLQAGFADVHVRSEVRMTRFASPSALLRYQLGGSPLAQHVAGAGDAVRDALLRDITTALQRHIDEDGVAFPIEGHIALARP